MNEMLIVAWLAGAALGGIFYGGLWWTVRRGVLSNHPACWFFGSLLVRMGSILVGFYLVSHGNWQRLTLCLFGFITARLLVTWLTRPRPVPEATHAP